MTDKTDLVVGALGTRIRLYGDIPSEVSATLVDLLEPDRRDELPTLSVQKRPGGWRVEGSPETTSALATTPMALADDLVAGLNRLGLNGDRSRLHLHAGVVQRDSDGIILCGPSNSGKSTLTATLVELGCDYLTDETATIIPGTSTVPAYPKPLALRGWAVSRYAKVTQASADARHIIPASSLGKLTSATRPSVIVFPQYHPDNGLAIRPIEPQEAVHRMVEDLLDGERFGSAALDELVMLVNRCTTWSVDFSNVESAAFAVLDMPAKQGTQFSRRWDEGHVRVASVGDREVHLDLEAKHLYSAPISASARVIIDGGELRYPNPDVLRALEILGSTGVPVALAGIGAVALDHPEGAQLGSIKPEIVVPRMRFGDAYRTLVENDVEMSSLTLREWPFEVCFKINLALLHGGFESPVLDPIDRFIDLARRIPEKSAMDQVSKCASSMTVPRALPLLADLQVRIEELGMADTWPDIIRRLACQVPGLPEAILSTVVPVVRPTDEYVLATPPVLDTDWCEHVARRPTAPWTPGAPSLLELASTLGTGPQFHEFLLRAVKMLGPLQTVWWLAINGSGWLLRFPLTNDAIGIIVDGSVASPHHPTDARWCGLRGQPDLSVIAEIGRPVGSSPSCATAVISCGTETHLTEVRISLTMSLIEQQVADLRRRSASVFTSSTTIDTQLTSVHRATWVKRSDVDALILHGVPAERLDNADMSADAFDAIQRLVTPESGIGGGLIDVEFAQNGTDDTVRAIGGCI